MNIFDAHISGSLSVSSSAEISNNLLISGNLTVLGTISGSISGSITNADTANRLANKGVTEFATTGSNSFNGNQTVTGSIVATQISSSFTGSGIGLYDIPASGITGLNLSQIAEGSSTASISSTNGLRVNTNTEITGALTATGQISGSFKGDGTNLYNIPASGVTGLNLTQIADGGATASISSTNGLRVNSNTEITGTLKLNKVKLGSDDIVAITLTDAGGKYYVNGVKNPRLSFIRGLKYRFYFDNNNVHPLLFSLTNDGEHNGGTVYTTGVTTGSNPFYVQIEVTDDTASTLYYFCDFHVGMGNSISVYSDFLNGQSSINLTNVDTGMFATTASNNFIGVQRTSGSLAVTGSVGISGSLILTGSVDITGSMTLNGEPIGTGKLDETIFNSYTTSSEGRFTGVETSTGSLNTFTSSANSFTSSVSSFTSSVNSFISSANSFTSSVNSFISSANSFTSSVSSFTSSIDTTIKNKLNTESVISGSIQINITETTGYSTVSSSISSSIGSLSSSVATTTSGLSSSIGSLSSSVATTTSGLSSSIGSLSSSVDTTIGALSSSVATTTNTLSGSIGSLSSSVATTTVGISSSLSSLSSSVATTTLNLKNRVDSIETSTGSLNSFTSSINTTIKDKMNADGVLSGSITFDISVIPGFSGLTSGVSSSISSSVSELSGSLTLTVTNLSSSLTNTDENQNNRINNLETSSGSLNSFTSSINTTIKSKLNTDGVISGSVQVNITETTNYSTFSSSIATTDSNQNSRLSSIEGNRATTGSNIFQGDQTITGSLFISENLIVVGSSSIQHISSSIVNIADNIITVNALNPSVRFGGLAVIDSGSSPQVSGSMLFDSVNNQWLFVHQDQSSVTSSVLLMGPETYNNLGGEAYLTLNRIPKGTGIEHLNDSNITDTGTKVSIDSNTEITGTLKVTGNITNPNITAIETSTGSLNTFTSSVLAAVELTGSNLTVKGNLIVKGTTTNVNTTTLDVDNNLINLNGTGATSAGLRVKDTTGPSQVSGSLLWDSTNDYWIAGQLGSEQRLVRETEFNNAVTRVGNIETSTGSLNSFTSSINTTIKSKLNTDGVISGSVQVNHNATTNYDANQHVDHTSVSVSAGNGLSGGGSIASTRTLTLDTGSVHFLDGVKKELNTEGVISGSAQVNHNATTNYDANQHIDHTTVSISAGSGLSGGGTIAATRTLSIATGGVTNDMLAGTIANAKLSNSAITIAGTSTSLGGSITAATILSGTGVFSGSAQLPSGTVTGSAQITYSGLTGIPSGLVSGSSQVTGIGNSQLTNSSFNIGTTSISLGRASAAQTLTGISIDGNSATVTNGVYITGDQTIAGLKTFSSNIVNSATADWYMYGFGARGASSGGYGMGLASDIANRTLSMHIPNVAAYSNTGATPKFGWYSNGSVELMTLQSATGNLVVTGTIGASNLSGTNTGDQTTITGNAGTVTNGVYTIGDQTIAGVKTFSGRVVVEDTVGEIILSPTGWRDANRAEIKIKSKSDAPSELDFRRSQGGREPGWHFSARGSSESGDLYVYRFDQTGAGVPDTSSFVLMYQFKTNGTLVASTFSGNLTGNASGTAANITASSNTSLTSLANLATVGTIATGVWNGTSIGTTYTAAKVTAVNAGTGVGVDTTTGSVTVSIGQSVATSAVPTFKAAILTSDTDSRVLKLRELASTSGNIIQFQDSAGNNKWEVVGRSNTDATPFYIYKNDGTNTGYIFSISGGGIPNFHTALTIGGSTAKSISNSSYSTTFTSVSSVTVTHSLGTKDVAVFVYDSSDNMFWPSSIVTTSTSVVTITFASSRSGRVVVVR